MHYNPTIHHRRSIRLKGYDYSQSGLYYVTICCQDRICRFGKIENGEMILNEYGQIAFDEWMKLPERYPNVFLDAFQIMPNHIHGIIVLNDTPVGATLAVAPFAVAQNNNAVAPFAVAQNNDADAQNNNAVVQNNNAVAHENRAGANNRATADNNRATADNNRGGGKPRPYDWQYCWCV